MSIHYTREKKALSHPPLYFLQVSSNGTWGLGVNSTIKWPKLPNFIYTIGGSNLTGLVANHTYSIA